MKALKIDNIDILLDDEDFERVSKFNWRIIKSFNTFSVYRQEYHPDSKCLGSGKRVPVMIAMANEVMQTKGIMYDHKDRNPSNNQKENLRVTTCQGNCANRAKVSSNLSSKYKGVCKRAGTNSWVVQIKYQGIKQHVGSFKDEVEAAKAYDKAAYALWGEFAYQNFPAQ